MSDPSDHLKWDVDVEFSALRAELRAATTCWVADAVHHGPQSHEPCIALVDVLLAERTTLLARITELESELLQVTALEQAGVDNWEGGF